MGGSKLSCMHSRKARQRHEGLGAAMQDRHSDAGQEWPKLLRLQPMQTLCEMQPACMHSLKAQDMSMHSICSMPTVAQTS
jgi:hypothetical protein